MSEDRFSKRFEYSPRDREIRIRDDAPEALLATFLEVLEATGLSLEEIRGEIVCPGLKKLPNSNNWSPGNIRDEVVSLVNACEWFKVYDLIERSHAYLAKQDISQANSFEKKSTNVFMRRALAGN